MSAIVWVHEDALNGELLHEGPGLYVFDEGYLQREGYTLKRIAFQYECLLELPVAIERGPFVETLLAFAAAHNAQAIVTTRTPNPVFQHVLGELQRSLPVRLREPAPFVELARPPDLKRFSRYWAGVETHLPI
jgi:hypothetical protein